MYKLILFFLLISGSVKAQTIVVNGQRVYTQSGVDAAIKTAVTAAIAAQAKIQATTDGVQNTRLTSVEKQDTVYFDKRYFNVIGRNVNFNIDSVQKYIKFPSTSVDLTAINNSIGLLDTRVGKVEAGVADGVIRLNSLEGWRTNAINDLKNINAAILKIPKTAVSTSTSTTTTNTTTTLQ